MTAGSEFRFDPTINPPRALTLREIFIELEAKVVIGRSAAERVQAAVGSLLMHLPPNPWSPLMQSSFRALQEHPGSAFAGTVEAPMNPTLRLPIVWRLQCMEGPADAKVASLRVGKMVEFADRAATLHAHAALAASLAVRPRPPWPSTVELPGAPGLVPIEAHPLRAIDRLEQVDLSNKDDWEDESYRIDSKRFDYDGVPTLIEMWGSGGYGGRTWVMLAADVVARYGSLDMESVMVHVSPHMHPERRPFIRERDGYVLINEI
jgi:hypothetical protein